MKQTLSESSHTSSCQNLGEFLIWVTYLSFLPHEKSSARVINVLASSLNAPVQVSSGPRVNVGAGGDHSLRVPPATGALAPPVSVTVRHFLFVSYIKLFFFFSPNEIGDTIQNLVLILVCVFLSIYSSLKYCKE